MASTTGTTGPNALSRRAPGFRILALLTILTVSIGVRAEDADPPFEGPWIGTNFIFIAPTTAGITGGGFPPGAALWLDLTDPLGAAYTTPVFADTEGRIAVDVPVDQPGIHQARVRDDDGQILAEDEVFVGVD